MHNKIYEMLEEGQETEEVFYTITEEALDYELEHSYEELSAFDKKAFWVGSFLREVNDGGFDQYFINTQGRYSRDTAELLDTIGEKSFVKLLEEAISIYKAVIPDDDKLREFEELDHRFYYISTEEYEKLYDKFIDYLKDYEEDQ